MTPTGVMNTVDGPAAEPMADTLKPFAGTGTTRGICMLGPRMKLIGSVGAPATGNTSVGVLGVNDVGNGASTTQTVVVPVLMNSAKLIGLLLIGSTAVASVCVLATLSA